MSESKDKPSYPTQQTTASPPTYSQSAQQQQPAVVVFDQGAAVKEGQTVNVPPPPPGVAPTPGQLAAMQGQQVQAVKEKKDVWGGGSDGGYTIF